MLRSPSPHTRALLDPNRPSSSTYRAVRAARASVSHVGLKTTAQRGTGTKVIRDCCERVQKGVTVIDISAPVLQRTLTKNKYVLRHEDQTQHEPNEVGREERFARPAFTLQWRILLATLRAPHRTVCYGRRKGICRGLELIALGA